MVNIKHIVIFFSVKSILKVVPIFSEGAKNGKKPNFHHNEMTYPALAPFLYRKENPRNRTYESLSNICKTCSHAINVKASLSNGRNTGAGSNTYLEYTEEGEPLEWIMEYANFDDS